MVIQPSDALIIVDVQNDFCPGGALAVDEGDVIVPLINAVAAKFEHLVFSRDWHPSDHCSFSVDPQFVDKSWPVHCVAHSAGAAFPSALDVPLSATIVSGGKDSDKEAYSKFEGTDLHHVLRDKNISRVFLCGLATDYCVLNTALSAVRNTYDTVLLEDVCRGVSADSTSKAIDTMGGAGIVISQSGDAM
jgi:nicotinamidase/pyrazinamidase